MAGSILEYIKWRGDLSFEAVPFCDVDNLIFSAMAYLPFDGVVDCSGAEVPLPAAARAILEPVIPERRYTYVQDAELIRLMAESTRYSGLMLSRYENDIREDEMEQFSAITARCGDNIYISFRGTDDTVVGWKEDFNMGYMTPVPSQLHAVRYVDAVAEAMDGRLTLCGHSKGGNLAIYSAVHCCPGARDRIDAVYNNDGPGFASSIVGSESYRELDGRIHTFLPQSSIVGMLLEHEERYSIVHSRQVGIMQHDHYTWYVEGGDFVYLKGFTDEGLLFSSTIRSWIEGMDNETRKRFVDALFSVLDNANVHSVSQLSGDRARGAAVIIKSIRGIDGESRRVLRMVFSELIRTAGHNLKAYRRGVTKFHGSADEEA